MSLVVLTEDCLNVLFASFPLHFFPPYHHAVMPSHAGNIYFVYVVSFVAGFRAKERRQYRTKGADEMIQIIEWGADQNKEASQVITNVSQAPCMQHYVITLLWINTDFDSERLHLVAFIHCSVASSSASHNVNYMLLMFLNFIISHNIWYR